MATTENEGTSSGFARHFDRGPQPLRDPVGEGPGPLLTPHAALVFTMAALIGAAAGALSYFSGTVNAAGALLAGLTASGLSATVLHRLIGR